MTKRRSLQRKSDRYDSTHIDALELFTKESLWANCCAKAPSRQLSNIDVYSAALLSTRRSMPGFANERIGNSRTTRGETKTMAADHRADFL